MQLDKAKQAPPVSGNNSRQKEIRLSVTKAVCITIGLALAIIGLYFLSQFNYLFFHTTVEVFSIVIAFAIFVIGWNSRRIINNNFLIVISIAFLFIGGLTLLHSLTYRGMNVFAGIDANWATQLWIAMRYLLSFSVVFALVFVRRKINPWIILTVFSVIFILLVGSIFFWQLFPTAYVDGQGLTTFKVASEYVISAILAVAILLLYRNRREFSGNVTNYLIAAMLAIIVAEMSFTLYVDTYGFFNLAGHLLNVVAFYLIYKAIVETGLSRPHDLLFFSIKKHEESLKVSEERFRGALDNMIEGCQIIGRDWRYIYINDAAERHNRRSRTELLGNRYMDMWPGIESTKVFEKIKECMETGIFSGLENFFVYPDGKTGWFELRINPIPEGVFILSMDVTERKLAEEARDVVQKKLEENACLLEEYANQMEELAEQRAQKLQDAERLAAIGATAGMVGHDIRNPLQAITGDLYFAKKDLSKIVESPEKQRIVENLSSIETSVNYINKIVQDLQDFARPIKPNIQETDVEALCKELMQQAKLLPSISTSCQVDESLKRLPVDGLILRRILTNLVTNAIQAMPTGGSVTLEAYKEGADAVITVADTGSGIPDDVKPKLFTPLMTTKSKGQGFGLAVVKRMTEALGGSVSFESEIGKGTKFIIRLPIKE